MHTTTSAPLDTDGRDHDDPPVLPFVHMWTGLDGRTRLDESALRGFGLQSVGGGADPQWLRPFPGEVSAIVFAALPVGWVGQWHPSPHPQWVIPLRGRWFLETQDGSRVEMGPGDIHFGQDTDSAEIEGESGHLSGTVGDEPCLQVLIQFAVSPAAPTAQPFG
ncbi:hypothetical protein [Microbacterium trichothecenolyticum]|uniref:Cupin domain-containing protein n=1 Tax=Microbacterium trichothecenolyticum TaxID=69370 RepID=A0ABU0TQ74_MICTR|nr:hypothetical protein [Microbacterium trichothecenolyticum]MDQ1121825.1 hypothetical protein [Microbacterium trichothecenolyticum]